MIDSQKNYTIDDSLKTSTTDRREKKGLFMGRRVVVCRSLPVAVQSEMVVAESS
jgi:hypothetical protein